MLFLTFPKKDKDIRKLTVCFFEPVIEVSKPRTLNLILVVIIHLLLDLLIRGVILATGKTTLWNPYAIPHRHLAVVSLINLIVSLKVGVTLLGLRGLVRFTTAVLRVSKVLRAMKVLCLSSNDATIGMLAH